MFRRRKFIRRPFRRRGFKRRAFGFARKKYDRITLFNNLQGDSTNGSIVQVPGSAFDVGACGPIFVVNCNATEGQCQPQCETPPCSFPVCCTNVATVRLIENGTLESFYQDRITIVSLYGDIYARNLVEFPVDLQLCEEPGTSFTGLGQFYARYGEQFSIGIRKFNTSQQPDERLITDLGTPLFDYDWTESRWLLQRHKFWAPVPWRREDLLEKGSSAGCCSNTHQAGYIVPAEADGDQPLYNVPAESTDCQPCVPDLEGACPDRRNAMSVREPPWHHWRIRIRRHITLGGDDNLDLQLAMRHPTMYSNASGWGCDTGFNGELTNTMYYVRIGAVVRLN